MRGIEERREGSEEEESVVRREGWFVWFVEEERERWRWRWRRKEGSKEKYTEVLCSFCSSYERHFRLVAGGTDVEEGEGFILGLSIGPPNEGTRPGPTHKKAETWTCIIYFKKARGSSLDKDFASLA